MNPRKLVVVAVAFIVHSAPATGATGGDPRFLAQRPITARLGLRSTSGVAFDVAGHFPGLAVGPFKLEGSAWAWNDGGPADSVRTQLRGEARIVLNRPGSGAWLGVSGIRSTHGAPQPHGGLFRAGAWSRRGGITLSETVQNWRASIPRSPVVVWSWTTPPGFQSPPDTFPTLPYSEVRAPLDVRVTSLESEFRWDRARWQLLAACGVALGRGISPASWAQAQMAWWIRPSVGVLAGIAGRAPMWLTASSVSRKNLSIGIQLEPGRVEPVSTSPAMAPRPAEPRWRMRALGAGRYELALYLPEAVRVSLRGDLTGWDAVDLESMGSGWWAWRIQAQPGNYQLEIQIDAGAWKVPPGMPTGAGAYGGEVGILVVESR